MSNLTISPNTPDTLTLQITDTTTLQLNSTPIVVVSGGGSGGDADTLQGQNGAYYLSRVNHTGSQAISTVSGLQTALDEKLESVAWGDITGTLSDQTDLQGALDLKLDAADYNDRFLGLFATYFDLVAAHPTASAGDYAQVDFGIGTDVIVYAWDVSDEQWVAVGSSAIANTDALPEGSSNLYFTSQRVRDTTLTGLSTATATPITAADSILSAAGKLQAQINAASPPRKYPAGVWSNQHVAYISTSATYTGSYFCYVTLPQAITITELGLAFATAVVGRLARIRFYTDAGLSASGLYEFDAAAVNAHYTLPASLTLPSGKYLIGVSHSGAGTASNLRNITPALCEPLPLEPAVSPNLSLAGGSTGYTVAGAFATSLPADISGSLPFWTQIAAQPAVFMLIV